MTELQLVREYLPGLDPDFAHLVLWETTCYPMSVQETRRQLAELAATVRPRKRGWFRRLARHVARIEHQTWKDIQALGAAADARGEEW